MKLKPFGQNSGAIEYGDLEHHIGWLEALASDEEENIKTATGLKQKRWMKVMDAIQLLTEANEM